MIRDANAVLPPAKRQQATTDEIRDESIVNQLQVPYGCSSSPGHSAGCGSDLASSDQQSTQSYLSEGSDMSSDPNFEAFRKVPLAVSAAARFAPARQATAAPQSVTTLYSQQHPTTSQQPNLICLHAQDAADVVHINMQQPYSHGGGGWLPSALKHKSSVASEHDQRFQIEHGRNFACLPAESAVSHRPKTGADWAFEDRSVSACSLNTGLGQIEGQGLVDSHAAPAVVNFQGGGLLCGPQAVSIMANLSDDGAQQAYLASLKASLGGTSSGCQTHSLNGTGIAQQVLFDQRLQSLLQVPHQLGLDSPTAACNLPPVPSLVPLRPSSRNQYGIDNWTNATTGSTELLLLPRIEQAAAVPSKNISTDAVYGRGLETQHHRGHSHAPYDNDDHYHRQQQHQPNAVEMNIHEVSNDTLPLSAAAAAHASSLHHNPPHVAFGETRQTPGISGGPGLITNSLDHWDKALDMALGRNKTMASMEVFNADDRIYSISPTPTSFPSRAQSPGLSLFVSSQRQRPSTNTISGFDSRLSHSGSLGVLRSSRFLRAAQQLLEEFCNVGRGNPARELVDRRTSAAFVPTAERADNCTQYEQLINPLGIPPADQPKSTGASTTVICSAAPATDHAINRAASESSAERSNCPSKQLPADERCHIQLRKARLIAMIEELDRRYRQYRDQMQLVITSFESAAGLGAAAPYTALARRAMSKHFRGLRDAIGDHIRAACAALGEDVSSVPILSRGETPRLRLLDQRLRHQRSLQQIGLLQHQAWRPQRGLPERSVSVLRAWLFEHFLHPYPKDSDKLMLARLTGLTRNQVSNWFINARVRLWKPMVEEMYNEESKELEREAALSLDFEDRSYPHRQQYHEGGRRLLGSTCMLAVQDGKRADEPAVAASFGSDDHEEVPDNNGWKPHAAAGSYYDTAGRGGAGHARQLADYAGPCARTDYANNEEVQTVQQANEHYYVQLQLAAALKQTRDYGSCAAASTYVTLQNAPAADPGLVLKEAGGSYVIDQAPAADRHHVMNDMSLNIPIPDHLHAPVFTHHDELYATPSSGRPSLNRANVKNCVTLTLGLQHSNNSINSHNTRAADQQPQSAHHVHATGLYDRSWAS